MKKTFIVANWKSNFTSLEAREWFSSVQNLEFKTRNEEKKVVICPSSTLLAYAKHNIQVLNLPWSVGAQNVSPFGEGAYTGEVSASQVKELAQYVIVGHSERRENFGETDEILFQKSKLAKEAGLTVIYCVQGKETKVPGNVDIVAYEPISAIGTGSPDTPENAEEVAAYFKANSQASAVLYGGSVTADNVNSFTKVCGIDGVLVGKASLDAKEFYAIIKSA